MSAMSSIISTRTSWSELIGRLLELRELTRFPLDLGPDSTQISSDYRLASAKGYKGPKHVQFDPELPLSKDWRPPNKS